MKKFKVYQIAVTSAQADEVNRLGSWEKAYEKFPHMKAKAEVSLSRHFKPEYSKFYTLVAEVEARGLEQVFDAMNGYPEEGVKVTHFARSHSMSVGDIAVCEGQAHFCQHFGWKEVEFNKA